MRLFIGIPLAHSVVQELSRVSRDLRSERDGLRWSSPESWHITLQFLGETSQERYDCVLQRLCELHSPRAAVSLEGLGFFDRAGVFFARVIVSPELLALQQRVNAATARCGFTPEDRPFHPHVTLARVKRDRSGKVLRSLKARMHRQPQFTEFTASESLLYEAFRGPGGSRYEVRERFALQP